MANTQMKQMFLALAQNPQAVLEQLSQNGIDPEQVLLAVLEAAQLGDPDAAQAMKVLQQMQLQSVASARLGAKLDYLKRLQGRCPEGYEMTYKFAKGGNVPCPVCAKKKQLQQDKCGGKVKKHISGGVTKTMDSIRSEMCGGKAKKACGGAKMPKGQKGIEVNDTIHTKPGDKKPNGQPYKVGTPIALSKKAEKYYPKYPYRGKGLTQKSIDNASMKDVYSGRTSA